MAALLKVTVFLLCIMQSVLGLMSGSRPFPGRYTRKGLLHIHQRDSDGPLDISYLPKEDEMKKVEGVLKIFFPSDDDRLSSTSANQVNSNLQQHMALPKLAVASKEERHNLGRQAQGLKDDGFLDFWAPTELTYGEYNFGFFCELVAFAREQFLAEGSRGEDVPPQPSFLEIGSGCGRLVFGAAMLWEWKLCEGIELIEPLHQLASSAEAILQKNEEGLKQHMSPTKLVCGDFNGPECGIERSDIIFSYCTTFPAFGNELTEMSAALGTRARPGTIVITTDKVLSPDGPWQFDLLRTATGNNRETAGTSTAYVWRVARSSAAPARGG
mmetsp:Transcript_38262/g.59795  ORF Transcript_38262/g.59795 Transcript_38262/m.59795 type:complete len:327 (+) Transcript_38262:165-1145(+)